MSVAYWLTSFGICPLLLEEREGLGRAASGRNAGFLIPGTAEHFVRACSALGESRALDLWAFTRESVRLLREAVVKEGIDCGLRVTGYLALAGSEEERKELEDSVALLERLGQPSRFLSREEIGERLGGEEGAAAFFGGREDAEGAVVHPARLVWGLARAAGARGAVLRAGARVQAIARDGRLRVESSRGAVRCEVAVVATNAYTGRLLEGWERLVTPVRGQMLATAPVDPVFPQPLSTNFLYEYWRQEGGRVILGGSRWLRPDMDEGHYSEDPTSEVQQGLEAFLRGTFPRLSRVPVERRWGGTMGFSPDGLPFIGPLPGRPEVQVSVGYSGHGQAFAFLAGKLLAEIIAAGRPGRPLTLFSPRRFLA